MARLMEALSARLSKTSFFGELVWGLVFASPLVLLVNVCANQVTTLRLGVHHELLAMCQGLNSR